MSTESSRTLSPEFRRLADEIRRICFGRIENLVIRNGCPDFAKPFDAICDVRFGGGEKRAMKPVASQGEFLVADAVMELLRYLEAAGNGVVVCLEIMHGLPHRMSFKRSF